VESLRLGAGSAAALKSNTSSRASIASSQEDGLLITSDVIGFVTSLKLERRFCERMAQAVEFSKRRCIE